MQAGSEGHLHVTIIGGYLGAGKTTLVNHLLRHAEGTRYAVLVNEFGALPIDEDLIEAQSDDLITIAGGCVCCSYGDDLIRAAVDMTRLDPPPDHVLLESSGVALPGAIAGSLSLMADCTLDAVVVVANAETVQAQAQDPYMGDTITRQLSDADMILLNKVDLLPPASVQKTANWIAELVPKATIIETRHCAVPQQLILSAEHSDHHHSADTQMHAAGLLRTGLLEMTGEVDADAVARALADPSLGLVRAKGFVATPHGLRLVQVVGQRWDTSPAPPNAKPGIVVIAPSATFDLDRVRSAVEALVVS